MWVIIVSENLADSRDSIIDGLLNDKKIEEKYVSKINNQNWGSSPSIVFANTWKTLSGAKRLIESHSANKHSSWRGNKFMYLQGKHLQARKITKEEWNTIIDYKLSRLKSQYERQKSKLESQKK